MIDSIHTKTDEIKSALLKFKSGQQKNESVQKPGSFQKFGRQLEVVFETSADGIWICSGQGKILALNRASERLNGVKAKDVIGKDVSVMVNKNIVDTNITPDVIKTKQAISKMQYIKRTGRHLMVTGTPAFDNNGNVELVVVNERDTTELNSLQKELKQIQLEKKQILSKLNSFKLMDGVNLSIVSEAPIMNQTLETALKLSQHEVSNILILGETGVGKGLMCKYIQQNSPRNNNAFIKINCAALPENLLEAELFGYESGAFTGANKKGKLGLFEVANKGILFLDEIGDMPLSIQSKLLKYLDDHEIMRLGGTKAKKIDCLIVAATNKDLNVLVKEKLFRRDLLHRVNNFVIKIPPLRERSDDILALTHLFLGESNNKYNIKKGIHQKGMKALQSHHFPGNTRELKNLIEEATLLSNKTFIDHYLIDKLKDNRQEFMHTEQTRHITKRSSLQSKLNMIEKELLSEAIMQCNSTTELAKQLSISQATASRKMKKYGLNFRTKR